MVDKHRLRALDDMWTFRKDEFALVPAGTDENGSPRHVIWDCSAGRAVFVENDDLARAVEHRMLKAGAFVGDPASVPVRTRPEMTTLRRVGFFRELGYHEMYGDNGGAIFPLLGKSQHPVEVIEYLRRGQLLIASPGPVSDVIDGSHGFVGTASVLTDGVWAWREDTIHYVKSHGLALPVELLKHMHERSFVVPELTRDQLRRLRL